MSDSLLIDSLPNPFAEGDARNEKLDALHDQVQDMQILLNSLAHSIGLLMRAECIRLDRSNKVKLEWANQGEKS